MQTLTKEKIEAFVEVDDYNSKTSQDYFAEMSRKPTREVTQEDLDRSIFMVKDKMGRSKCRAKVMKIINFNIFNLIDLMRSSTNDIGIDGYMYQLCGFDHAWDAKEYFMEWLSEISFKTFEGVSFKYSDTFSLYIYQKL